MDTVLNHNAIAMLLPQGSRDIIQVEGTRHFTKSDQIRPQKG
jgi:hypothetical protein